MLPINKARNIVIDALARYAAHEGPKQCESALHQLNAIKAMALTASGRVEDAQASDYQLALRRCFIRLMFVMTGRAIVDESLVLLHSRQADIVKVINLLRAQPSSIAQYKLGLYEIREHLYYPLFSRGSTGSHFYRDLSVAISALDALGDPFSSPGLNELAVSGCGATRVSAETEAASSRGVNATTVDRAEGASLAFASSSSRAVQAEHLRIIAQLNEAADLAESQVVELSRAASRLERENAALHNEIAALSAELKESRAMLEIYQLTYEEAPSVVALELHSKRSLVEAQVRTITALKEAKARLLEENSVLKAKIDPKRIPESTPFKRGGGVAASVSSRYASGVGKSGAYS